MFPKHNREISWLSFNKRVLQEALDASVPVLERLRFLGIYSNNLDEFFRVRVGTLNKLLGKNLEKSLNFNPEEVLDEIYQTLKKDEYYFARAFSQIKKDLAANGVFFLHEGNLKADQLLWVKQFFKSNIRQGITPLILKDSLKFPAIKDKSIYLAIKMSQEETQKTQFSLIEIPTDYFSRFVEVPCKDSSKKYVMLLDDIIRVNLSEIFKVFEMDTFEAYTIKVTRDAELEIDNDISNSIVDKLSKSLKLRKKGKPVRFIADKRIPADLLHYILKRSQISKRNVVLSGKYHNFKDFTKFPDFGMKHLLYDKNTPIPNLKMESEKTIFNTISKKDVLLFYPFNSFDYLLNFLREASIDPHVNEIKMSLYRLSKKSQIANILINAVKNGKKVTVVMEVTARFDEENNIYWAKQMEEEGIKVLYGNPNLKVHSKIVYITKKQNSKTKYFCNISTGNYNEVTANIYSDISLFTSQPDIAKDVANVFKFLETQKPQTFKKLMISPFSTRSIILQGIDHEIKAHKEGKKGYILFKMNSLVDDQIIDKLYEASQIGVEIKLIIRGICCLIPNLPGISENIEAISIIDKFLEHARVYYFKNNPKEKLYISSADLMPRNIDFRVEVGVPIIDKLLQKKILNYLNLQLKDNQKSRFHDLEMSNEMKREGIESFRSQIEIYNWIQSDYDENLKNKK
jgi:polyphosphate kinase